MKKYYIAYGSNLNTAQMEMRCPDAVPVAVTELKNYKLVFQGRRNNAHANVIPAKGHTVPVVIWQISRRDEMSLDVYEGVRGGYYYKDYLPVDIDGKTCLALIYIMTPHGYGLPTDGYLYTIVEGYRDFNLDARILNNAVLDAQSKTFQNAVSM